MRARVVAVVVTTSLAAAAGTAAAVPAQPALRDLLGPASGGPAAVGTAEPGAIVLLYPSADCSGSRIASALAAGDGAFALAFSAPATDTPYSVRALDLTGLSPCAPALTYHVIHDECPVVPSDRPVTRPPRSGIIAPLDYMPQWKYGDDPASVLSSPLGTYTSFQAAVAAEEPELVWMGGLGTFHHHMTGAISGVPLPGSPPDTPIVGNGSMQGLDAYMDLGPLPADQLFTRFGYLQDYLSTIRPHTRPGIYMDFGTQVYSDLTRTAGLWAFYSQWESYADFFAMGTQPPPVNDWLRKTWDEEFHWPDTTECVIPDELAGLAPEYCPVRGNGWYRFALNPLSEGFTMYWKLMLEWAARAGYGLGYFDNAYQRFCWNDECEDGYLAWIGERYDAAEIDRYLTETSSRLTHHSSFDDWSLGETGIWSPNNGAMYTVANGAAVVSPDLDAVRGRYSLRVDTLGPTAGAVMQLHPDGPPGDWVLGMQVRTTCAGPTLYMEVFGQTPQGTQGIWTQTVPLPDSQTWVAHTIPFTVPPEALSPPVINMIVKGADGGDCSTWLDELTAVLDGETPTSSVRLWRHSLDTQALHLRRTETYAYWDSIPDTVLPDIKQAALAIDPDFWLLTNSGKQRRGAEAYFVERALLEPERAMLGRGAFPGTYTAGSPTCTINANPNLRCHPAGGPNECSCIDGKPIYANHTVDNVLDYKVTAAERYADEFAYRFHIRARFDGHYLLNRPSAILALAEDAAFSGGALSDLQLESDYWRYSAALGETLRTIKIDFLDWAEAHGELFRCLTSTATVGLMWHDVGENETADPGTVEVGLIAIAEQLSDAGVTYDVISAKNLTADNLARHRVLIYADLPRIGSAEALMVADYLAAGGIVLASEDAGLFDEYYRRWDLHPSPLWPPVTIVPGQGTYPVGLGTFVWFPEGLSGSDVLSVLPDAQVFPSLTPAQRATTRAAFWSAPGRFTAHILNYDIPVELALGSTPAGPLLTSVEVAIPTGTFIPSTATIYSPETGTSQGSVPVTTSGGISTVIIPYLAVYAVVLLE
jgi:hypothetical protein